MPSKTPKQARFMKAIAHGWKPSGKKGPSKKVAKDFVAADARKKKSKPKLKMQMGGLARVMASPRFQQGRPQGAQQGAPRPPRGRPGGLDLQRPAVKQTSPQPGGALQRAIQSRGAQRMPNLGR